MYTGIFYNFNFRKFIDYWLKYQITATPTAIYTNICYSILSLFNESYLKYSLKYFILKSSYSLKNSFKIVEGEIQKWNEETFYYIVFRFDVL